MSKLMDDTVAQINKLSKIINELQVKKIAKENEISKQELEYENLKKELIEKYNINEDDLSSEIEKTEKELFEKTEDIKTKIENFV
jgi:hypothetical protein